jgi:hypothetical protein
MERGRSTYNVGGALEASMEEAIALFERVSGKRLTVLNESEVPGD